MNGGTRSYEMARGLLNLASVTVSLVIVLRALH